METLEQYILELDAVEIQGQEDVRSLRRAAVVEIQQLIQMLEFRSQFMCALINETLDTIVLKLDCVVLNRILHLRVLGTPNSNLYFACDLI
ncbi:hypothetical protein EG68_09963 [Paragonimus skrjabini miyazakii]|uniref:BAG domain-containing protein n=1 Tax=Paragonimus skrjabini miyazakii TaxID=59628 RepID=A0A8S9YZZ9_9TREM|nr:hypothetical protein EG68_09963 [Paragonimus skrjabini miyazakii]